MGLFSHKKDEKEHAQTQEIKNATTQPPSQEMSANSNFNNPFAQNQQQIPQENNQNQHPEMQNGLSNDSQTNIPGVAIPPQNQQQMPPNMSQVQENPFENNNPPQGLMQEQTHQENNFMPQNDENKNALANMDEERMQELIDETVEKIVAERWERVTNNVERVLSWKGKIEQELDLLKEDIMSIKTGFESFEKRLVTKISNYDKNILDVNSEIKALEKVFQKITPTLVNNVNELSRIADELNGAPSKSKKLNNEEVEIEDIKVQE